MRLPWLFFEVPDRINYQLERLLTRLQIPESLLSHLEP
jgi:hypothetical protein